MTQLGEGVAVAATGPEKCVFCERTHQDQKPAPSHTFPRDMDKLKKEGRSQAEPLGRTSRYPSKDKPPLSGWESDIEKTGGYKAAAHHCIALKSVSGHMISGELHCAGYDPNEGSNCIWLPYSRVQFIRARAYLKALQKHRGGHTDQYFKTVEKHVDTVADSVAKKFCATDTKATKEALLRYIKGQEGRVWLGVAQATDVAYHLYNTSFLNPKADWGTYDEEQSLSREDYLGLPPDPRTVADDQSAETESADDPE